MHLEKYCRYQITSPIISNKIYKSKSMDRVIKKIYNDYKNNDLPDTFSITNLDTNIEYKFKINENGNIEMKDIFDDIDTNQINKNYSVSSCIII